MRDYTATNSLALGVRTAALSAVTAGGVALGLLLMGESTATVRYFWHNQGEMSARMHLVSGVFGAAGFAGAAALAFSLLHEAANERLWRCARALAPLGPLAMVPILFRWDLWQGHDLAFLFTALIVVLAVRATVTASILARPAELFGWATGWRRDTKRQTARWLPRPSTRLWLGVVVAASLLYAVWFSYYMTVWHLSSRTSWDTSIENNILWNLLHGHFYKAAPAMGPNGVHFARHSTLFAYLLVPFYALHQSAETVLILQSTLMGASAIPLFLFARGRIGAPIAALISILYLMHPAVQESNLFEAHYIKFGTPVFWTTLWLLDSKRYRLALLFACLTLSVREDVATWILLLGVWGLMTGRALRTSLTLAIGGAIYVGVVKFVIMPSFAGGEDQLAFMYQELMPPGKTSFAWAFATAFTNPAFFVQSLLDIDKLVFLLQILIPLAFVPLRRAIGWYAMIPGTVFCLMATHYPALVDIHFQYSHHFLAFLYPALVLVLESFGGEKLTSSPESAGLGRESCLLATSSREVRAPVAGILVAITVGTLVCSAQYGAVIQQHTSRGGPIPFKFGWDNEGRGRHHAITELLKILPSDAAVAASAFTTPQITNRENGYSLSIDLYDADWILVPSLRGEYLEIERQRTIEALASGAWGVVAVRPPFMLIKRGYKTDDNARRTKAIR
jgi:uncharacterized membrane protein